jgi:hypothetical protein
MSEIITYWDNAGNNYLYKNIIKVGGFAYVAHDEKTITLVDSYTDADGEERQTTRTYKRNFEDAKEDMLKYLREHLASIEKSIKKMEEYREP